MIAVLKLLFADRFYYAALHDNGRWTSNDGDVAWVLNANHNPNDAEQGPATGPYGEAQVNQVLEKYQGKVIWRQPQDDVERVY